MKKYKFFETTSDRIIGSSRGYFDYITKHNFPEEFTFEDVKQAGFLSISLLKRIEKARVGTIIKITSLGRNSNLSILVVDSVDVDKIRQEIFETKSRIENIDKEIDKVFHDLIVEKKSLNKNLEKLNKKVKYFNINGILK